MKNNVVEKALAIVEKSEILSIPDIKELKELEPELQETFLKSQVFRTRTEMEISVLNDIKFPTPASKYWQAVREQNVMLTELIELSYEYRKKIIQQQMLERDLVNETDELKQELIKIDLERNLFHLAQMQKVAKARIREIQNWSEIKARESQYMTEKELEDVDNHQLISYTQRWIKQAQVMGNSGSPAERQNLLGQLYSGYKLCEKKGLLNQVLANYSDKEREVITNNIKQLRR